ncbi:MAG: LysM peptidoglycan-binding domain-containing protein [Deltaproteobacteria bacterium]
MNPPRTQLASSLACLALVLCARAAAADVVHQVRPGETLASIADHYYGDPAREALLVAANVLNAQANLSITPGMRIMIPSVGYYRVQPGDTWLHLAQREMGAGSRAPYLAQVNNANAMVPPAAGSVLRVPYLLRYVVLADELLVDIVRRYEGERVTVPFVLDFNHLSSSRMQRGQVVMLPMADLTLREEPVCESAAPLASANAVQRQVDHDIPALASLAAHGQYVEAVALGSHLARSGPLSVAQRVAVDRSLAEALSALDRADLAAEAFRDALEADHSLTLDENTTAPKVLEAFGIARGLGSVRQIAPAPATARPDSAH